MVAPQSALLARLVFATPGGVDSQARPREDKGGVATSWRVVKVPPRKARSQSQSHSQGSFK